MFARGKMSIATLSLLYFISSLLSLSSTFLFLTFSIYHKPIFRFSCFSPLLFWLSLFLLSFPPPPLCLTKDGKPEVFEKIFGERLFPQTPYKLGCIVGRIPIPCGRAHDDHNLFLHKAILKYKYTRREGDKGRERGREKIGVNDTIQRSKTHDNGKKKLFFFHFFFVVCLLLQAPFLSFSRSSAPPSTGQGTSACP